jgi:hypothetical protein
MSKILFLACGLLLAGARVWATPVDNINIVFPTGATYTAGVSTNNPGGIQVHCFRNGSQAPNEVETIRINLVKDGVVLEDAVSPSSFQTSSGVIVYGGSLQPFTFYHAGSGLKLRATAPSGASEDGEPFTVNPGTAAKLVVVAPGQSHDPGKNPAPSLGHTGRSGTATAQQPNSNFSLTVILTDNQFNKVAENHNVSFASGDLVTLPSAGSLSSGQGSFNVSIAAPKTSRTITVTDTTDSSVRAGSVEVTTSGPPADEVFPFPSPFNPKQGQAAKLRFYVGESGNVTLKVTDAFGQDVWRKEVSAEQNTFTDVTWDGRNENGHLVASGVYYVLLEMNGSVKSKKRIGVVK